jgi:Flp pilus assembly protein CpaB
MLRRSPRVLLLWAGAFALALLTALFVASDLVTLHRHAHDLGPERAVVVARRDLALGATIGDGALGTRRVHASQLPSGVLEGNVQRLAGRIVAAPVLRGEFVSSRNLAPRRRTGLDGIVPAGMRAIRVVASDSLRPPRGAAVDVLATFEHGQATGATGDAITGSEPAVVVAHGVTVLATDDATHTGSSTSGTGTGVTLLVQEPEARRLAYAAATGTITLALVPPEDASSRSATTGG